MIMKRFSILFILFLGIFTLSACSEGVTSIFSSSTEITFGMGSLDEGITVEKSTFTQNEDFLMELTTSEQFGTSNIEFMILKTEADGIESIYDQWSDTVDPTWNYFIYEFHIVDWDGTFDSGDYKLKIFNNNSDLMAQGEFTIE